MADNKKKSKAAGFWLVGVACVALVAAAIAFIVNNGSTTNEVTITGTTKISGIRCADTAQMNAIFQDYTPTTHTNIITASFADDTLASITYTYAGEYVDVTEADHARDFAEAAYYDALAEDGLEVTAFSKNISVSENTVHASITATDGQNLSSRTAPIFMLSKSQTFPTSLKGLESAYENAGFSCEAEN